MDRTWIDIVDSAVKIGLGSLITGVFAFLGLKFKNSSEKERFMLEHKTKLLEQISSDVHEYLMAWRYFSSLICGIAKQKNKSGNDGTPFSEYQFKEINVKDDILTNSWPQRESAVAKLTLLKANKTVEAIEKCRKSEGELRHKIFFDNVVPTYAEAQKYTDEGRHLVTDVNKELSIFYATLED
jgi:hypothetical protein